MYLKGKFCNIHSECFGNSKQSTIFAPEKTKLLKDGDQDNNKAAYPTAHESKGLDANRTC